MLVGYCRVSSEGQNLEAQRGRLEAAGCEKVFEETAHGGTNERPQLDACLSFVREGDTLITIRLDRLTRADVADTFALLKSLERRGVGYRSLDEPVFDTAGPFRDAFIAMIACVNNMFLAHNKERQRAGIELAKQQGKYTGGKVRFSPDDIRAKRAAGARPCDIARELGCSEATVHRALANGGANV